MWSRILNTYSPQQLQGCHLGAKNSNALILKEVHTLNSVCYTVELFRHIFNEIKLPPPPHNWSAANIYPVLLSSKEHRGLLLKQCLLLRVILHQCLASVNLYSVRQHAYGILRGSCTRVASSSLSQS